MHKQASSVFASLCDCQHFGKFKQVFLIVWEEKASFWCDDLDTKSSVLHYRTGLFFSSLHRDFLYKQFLWMQSSVILLNLWTSAVLSVPSYAKLHFNISPFSSALKCISVYLTTNVTAKNQVNSLWCHSIKQASRLIAHHRVVMINQLA